MIVYKTKNISAQVLNHYIKSYWLKAKLITKLEMFEFRQLYVRVSLNFYATPAILNEGGGGA